MKRIGLEVEHHYKDRFVGRHQLKSKTRIFVVGASLQADVRLLGPDVSGVHAVIEYQDGHWVVSDLGSEKGTWINKEAIANYKIDKPTQVRIGGHQLKLVPKEASVELFKNDAQSADNASGEVFHQVVLSQNGFVKETHLLPPNESFKYSFKGNNVEVLPSKKLNEWQRHDITDGLCIQSRMVKASSVQLKGKELLMDPQMRGPLGVVLAFVMVFIMLLVFIPLRPNEDLNLKPEKNQFTKIIYDAKTVKQMRAQALNKQQRVLSKSAAQAPSTTPDTKPLQATNKGAQLVTKIKAAGLSQLIGKISMRAAKTAHMIHTTGLAADTATTGTSQPMATATTGTAKTLSGTQYKVGAVGTEGKGGGTGTNAYKGAGGLQSGAIGTGGADVGVIEEESEIQGGLDREIINSVIKSQLGQIRYCYERQLSANPDLYGKVSIKFTIDGSGAVITQQINNTTLKNAMVEGCILRRVALWKFPKPQGGTSVIVTYPFLFKSTN